MVNNKYHTVTYFTTYQNVYYHTYNFSKINLALKRMLDLLLSGFCLLIVSPLMLIISVAIVSSSKGGVFFRQKRIGQYMKPFIIYKFRTMEQDAEKKYKRGEVLSGNDPRLTAVGKILRRTKLDEIPQLINIFKGEMSFVGPRPMLPRHKKMFKGKTLDRFLMRPGLTGIAQIHGGIFIPFEDRFKYDLVYIRSFSFLLDLKILVKTVFVILLGEGRFAKPYERTRPSVQRQAAVETAGNKRSIA